jgi:hypothetical protein
LESEAHGGNGEVLQRNAKKIDGNDGNGGNGGKSCFFYRKVD